MSSHSIGPRALLVLALALAYTLVATIDPTSISNTDPNSAAVSVLADSIYDMTLVASGTGFGHRVPMGAGAKAVTFVCASYLTIGMTMTVFARILSSSAMYMRTKREPDHLPTTTTTANALPSATRPIDLATFNGSLERV